MEDYRKVEILEELLIDLVKTTNSKASEYQDLLDVGCNDDTFNKYIQGHIDSCEMIANKIECAYEIRYKNKPEF